MVLVIYQFLSYVVYGSVYYTRYLLGLENDVQFRQRFGFYKSTVKKIPTRKTLWIHGASIGETITSVPLIQSYAAQHPHMDFIITCSTTSGDQVVSLLCNDGTLPRTTHVLAPVDTPSAITVSPDIAFLLSFIEIS
jgi:3-deoxy-D-manno-octulosonic-acid transferase